MRKFNLFSDRGFNPKLKTQLTASFIATNLLVILIISLFLYNGVMGILKQQSVDMVTQQSRQSEFNILSYRDQIERVSGLLAINKSLQEFINTAEDSEQPARISQASEIIRQFDSMIGTYSFIDSIYLFCPNGEAVADSFNGSWYNPEALEKCAFYKTDLYRKIKEQGYGFLWDGTRTTADFELMDYTSLTPGAHYVTVVRNIKTLSGGGREAVIAINIKQNNFVSIYNGMTGDEKNNRFLVDLSGRVVSGSDTGLIGQKTNLAEKINPSLKNGSFSMNIDNTPNQVIYYRLGETGWVLVNAIPESDFIRNIFTLKKIILLLSAICIALALLLSFYWIFRITKPFTHLMDTMKKIGDGNLGILLDETPRTELGMIGRQFNRMSKSIEELIDRNQAIEEDKRQLEMEALQTQINPHFLYNALNTLKWIAVMKNETGIADGITSLGNMLRPVFQDRSLMVTLGSEMEYIRNYLKIMNARYGEGVSVTFEIPEELSGCMILRFILQPVVENSFVHGMNSRNYVGDIRISVRQSGKDILICVEDNGCGITEQRLSEIGAVLSGSGSTDRPIGIGLFNVNRRLRLQYGEGYGLTLQNAQNPSDTETAKGTGTLVILKIPIIAVAEKAV